MFNFKLLFLRGFSSKNCEILNKAVLTPQEYNDYFFLEKNQKKMHKKLKNLLGVSVQCSSQDWSQKIPLAKFFFLVKSLFEQTPPNSKKMGSKSEKWQFTNIFTRFFERGHLKYLDAHKMRAKVPKSLLISVHFVPTNIK